VRRTTVASFLSRFLSLFLSSFSSACSLLPPHSTTLPHTNTKPTTSKQNILPNKNGCLVHTPFSPPHNHPLLSLPPATSSPLLRTTITLPHSPLPQPHHSLAHPLPRRPLPLRPTRRRLRLPNATQPNAPHRSTQLRLRFRRNPQPSMLP